MAFDNSANFSFTGTTTTWEKRTGIGSVYFIVKGAGGSGSTTSSGGGGGYVFCNLNYLVPDISYNVTINVGGGGKAPYTDSDGILHGGPGGKSVGGITGETNSNGGDGTVANGLQSGGGGGMTSVFYMDGNGQNIIKIIAGGGGGGGINAGGKGGDAYKIGLTGSGVGGGQGGNTYSAIDPPNPAFPPGNAGLGGIAGGVNGYNYEDSSNNGLYTYIGGGGGSGGSFAGGGGGGGYGGGAGGKEGGGGGGGSYASIYGRNIFVAGGGGLGGKIGQDASGGSVRILWNSKPPIPPPAIVGMYMLNPQHTSKSSYTAPTILPTDIIKYHTASPTFSNQGVISSDNELYIIADNGILYAFDHTFAFSWSFVAPFGTFIGTPALSNNGTLYIASSQNYLFAVVDAGGPGGSVSPLIKWNYPINGKAVSPIIDLSNNIYFGTDTGYIYGITDFNNQSIPLWTPYRSPDSNPILKPLALNVERNKICYITTDSTNSYVYAIDISKNVQPQQRWPPITFITSMAIIGTPSIDPNGIIYLGISYLDQYLSILYAYDISNGLQLWNKTVNNIISDTAIDGNNIYVTSSSVTLPSETKFMIFNSSNGAFIWSYTVNSLGLIVAPSTPTVDANNNVYFGYNNNLYSINAATRKFNWKYPAGGAIRGMPIISNNQHIYFGANDGFIYDLSGNGQNTLTQPVVPMYMLNPQHTGISSYYGPTTTPIKQWSNNFGATNLYVSPSIGIGSDDTLYIGSNDGYVYAFNPDGSTKWSLRVNSTENGIYTSPQSIYTTPAIGQNGTIYIGSNEGLLYAVNPNGTLKWSYNVGYPLQSSPIIDNNGFIYFGAGQSVFSLGDAEGKYYTRWLRQFDTSANLNSSPALGQNGYLYFGSDDGYLYAVDSLTGLSAWPRLNLSLPDTIITHPIYTSATVDISNNVIIGNGSYMDGSLNYIDGLTGNILWQTSYEPKNGPFYNTVAVKDDTIYLSTIAYVFAIDRLTGNKKWKFFSFNCYYTSPVVDASGIIYVASINANTNHGTVLALKDNGTTVETYWPPYDSGVAYERFAPPVLGKNKTIYISSSANVNSSAGNKIYALK
jgi:outer membrane protein assembly factor BamB